MNLSSQLNPRKIVVTGAAGFIGSNLIDDLLDKGYQVWGVDNIFSVHKNNLIKAKKHPQFKFFEGDIRDEKLMQEIIPDSFAVMHLAAIVSVPLCTESPEIAVSVNIDGFSKVLITAAKNNVERFIYASSCAVYGDQGDQPIAEEAPLCPMSLYAVTKEANEKIAFCISKTFPIITHGLRYFNVYGERQDPKGPYAGVIAKFAELIKMQKAPTIFGSGNQTRDFVHVKNVTSVMMNLLSLNLKQAEEFKALNVASGNSRSVLEIWDTLLKASGIAKEVAWNKLQFVERRANDILHSKANLDKLHRMFNLLNQQYSPLTLEQGVSCLL